MTQANNLLTLTEPQMDIDVPFFMSDPDIDDDMSSDLDDDLDDAIADPDSKKTRKVAASRRKDPNKKKPYTEDSIRIYLQEIGRIRLLRAEEEIELARQIADLLKLERIREDMFAENKRFPSDRDWGMKVFGIELIEKQLREKTGKEPKEKDIEAALANAETIAHLEMQWNGQATKYFQDFKRRVHIGRRAKDKMVQSNLRLVVSIAKKYMNRGLSFQDLIQEGSLGLIRAAEKFDHEKGYKFSTYATWWIRQAITRAIADQSRTIRLPVHLYETISRIKKTTKILSQEMRRKPTEEEIADRMEMTIEKLRFIAKSAQLPISLETPIGKEEDSRLGDFIEADGETPEDEVSKNLLREDLENVLDTLSARERDVLRLRYGLDDGRMKTLEEIGQIFNVTRERIRQIEAKALRKLRHPNRNSILKEYIR